MSLPRISLLVATLCLSLLPSAGYAHRPGEAYLFLRCEDDSVSVRVEATLADLSLALGLPLDADGDGEISDAEFESHYPTIESYVRDRVSIALTAEDDLPLQASSHGVRTHSFGRFALVEFAVPDLREVPDRIEVEYQLFFDVIPDHRGFLVIERNTKTGVDENEAIPSLVFTPVNTRQTADLTQPLGSEGVLAFVRHGIWHIWIGLDHILFVLLLVMTSVVRRDGRRWTPVEGFAPALLNVVKIITLFTVAHTITLSLAALGVISLPPRLVEMAIALSVLLVAINNLTPIFGDRTWVAVFCFGLFHGIGFANVLGFLTHTRSALVKVLVGFNVGVEIGQVAVIIVTFLLLFAVREMHVYRRVLLPACSVAIGLVATFWFFERALGTG